MTISRRMAYLEQLFATGGSGGTGGASINDLLTAINSVWSSTKISTELGNRDTTIAALKNLLNGGLADLSGLTTAQKTTLVAAINELVTSLQGKAPTAHTHVIADVTGVATARFAARVSAGSGALEAIDATQAKAMLAIAATDVSGIAAVGKSGSATDLITGTLPAARLPQFTGGDVTTAGVGSITFTIGAGVVSLAKMAQLGAGTIIGNNGGASATPLALTATQVTAMLNNATGTLKGLMSNTDFTKLAGIATAATANNTDAFLTARANHTGTQPTNSINIAATARFVGRVTAAAGPAEELTGTQATALLDVFTASAKGLVPPSGGSSSVFLRGDGLWATPTGTGGSGGTGGAGTTVNPVTFTNSGTGNAPGITFDGSAIVNISYNTIGAVPQGQVVSSNLTMTSGRLLGRTTANGGAIEEITIQNGITLTGGALGLGAIAPQSVAAVGAVSGSNLSGTNTGDQTITLTGDVTGSGKGSFAATISARSVTFAKFQAATQASFIGALSAGNFQELTSAQATAQLTAFVGATAFVAGTAGVVPAPAPGENGKYLRGDGTWAAVPSGVVTLTGDVSGTGTGTFATTITPRSITFGKLLAATQSCVIGAVNPGDFVELPPSTLAQMLPVFDPGTNGFVPAPGGSAGKFLKDDGTWATPVTTTADVGFTVNATGTAASQNITLSAPVDAKDVLVFVNGLFQVPNTDYTVVGTTLTITTKNVGDAIVIMKPVSVGAGGSGTTIRVGTMPPPSPLANALWVDMN